MTGVTIHLLNERPDSGDILEQEAIPVPDGISYAQLEARCATKGGELLTRAVQKLWRGDATRRAQDEAASSYYPFPAEQDYVVQAEEWDARHLYNFVKGVGHWGGPVEIHTGKQIIYASDAISYSFSPSLSDEESGAGEMINILCRNGIVSIKK